MSFFFYFIEFVRMEGVEPTRLAALDPKSSASANFATSALRVAKIRNFYKKQYLLNCFPFFNSGMPKFVE